MIRYRLRCAHAHEFEAWFGSSESYEVQAAARDISCPECGEHEIAKAIMAPNVASRDRAVDEPQPRAQQEAVRVVRRALLATFEDVGSRFPEEARKIHHGETEARGIRGMASSDEVHALLEEGIEVLPVPALPEDSN